MQFFSKSLNFTEGMESNLYGNVINSIFQLDSYESSCVTFNISGNNKLLKM